VQAGAYPEAVEQLRLAAEYDGSDRMAWSQLAIALRRLGRNEEAAAAVDALKRIVIADAQPKADLKRIRIVPAPHRPQHQLTIGRGRSRLSTTTAVEGRGPREPYHSDSERQTEGRPLESIVQIRHRWAHGFFSSGVYTSQAGSRTQRPTTTTRR